MIHKILVDKLVDFLKKILVPNGLHKMDNQISVCLKSIRLNFFIVQRWPTYTERVASKVKKCGYFIFLIRLNVSLEIARYEDNCVSEIF